MNRSMPRWVHHGGLLLSTLLCVLFIIWLRIERVQLTMTVSRRVGVLRRLREEQQALLVRKRELRSPDRARVIAEKAGLSTEAYEQIELVRVREP